MKKTILASMLAVMMATPAFAAESTDIVIIGSGGAGLSSAITATEKGAKVIVLEKMAYFGGNSNRSEGEMNAAGTKQQKAHGILDDTPERFAADTIRGGHGLNDPALVKALTENAASAEEWLLDLGAHFCHRMGRGGGQTRARGHGPCDGSPVGIEIMRVLGERADKDHIDMRLNNRVTKILMKNGKVAGVQVKTPKGMETINAKSVILATGGFGANVAYRQKGNTGVWKNIKLDNSIGCTNIQKAAQGQGLFLAQKVGAKLIGLSDIQIHPCGTPGTGLMENIRTSGRNRIFVNSDGNRFVNEGAARDVLANAIFQQKGRTYWIVVNKLRYPTPDFKDRMGASIRNMEALGAVVEAPTLDELAKKTGMNAENLKKAIADYNAVVSGKAKDKLGFVANNKDDKQMTEGPWYACRKVPTVHHTMGGIKINVKSQVINTKGKVIPGLYAVGEVTGGIHGSNRLGGNAIADIMTFGHAVGPHIVQGK